MTSATGAPLNLAGYTVASQMRKNSGSSTSYDIPCTIVDPALGRIKIRLDSASTNDIPAGRYFYDVEITDAGGEKLRVIEGIITIIPQMTRI
jgi:hypothetical protein